MDRKKTPNTTIQQFLYISKRYSHPQEISEAQTKLGSRIKFFIKKFLHKLKSEEELTI